MTSISWSPRAFDDLDRILSHLAEHAVEDAGERVAALVSALNVLEQNPMIGRPVERGMRELVIGHRTRGYVALYEYLHATEDVRVAVVRWPREAGY